jgi:hypothetical protein
MESYVLIDSVQRSSGVSNAYTYALKKVLKGVRRVDLLSAAFPKQTSCTHVVLDIAEFRSPVNYDTNFGVINNFVDINSNIAYTTNSFYPLQTTFDNPFDIGNLNVTWRDPTGNTIPIGNNSFLLKISHVK